VIEFAFVTEDFDARVKIGAMISNDAIVAQGPPAE
jgi:hypothetical protein